MPRAITLPLTLTLLLFVTFGSAQQAPTGAVPNLIRYGGTLKGPDGATLSSATVGVTFAIYKEQDGGAPIWMETQNVTLDATGQYSVLLGSTTSAGLPTDLFSPQEQRWLGIQIQGQAELPRALLVTVPYAFKAHEAETLGGLPAAAFVKASSPDVSGSGAASASSGAPQDGKPGTGTIGGGPLTVINCLNAAVGRIPVFTAVAPPNITICNSGIYEAQPYGTGAIGILNPNPLAPLDVNGNINTNAGYEIGGRPVLTSTATTQNLFVGLGAGARSTGAYNTFVGVGAGPVNTIGSDNTIVGRAAGYFSTSGKQNSFIGSGAGYLNSMGNYNTFMGWQAGAGLANTTGSYNTAIGWAAGPDAASQNLTNATAVGFAATVSQSNSLVLGGDGPNAVNVGIGTRTPSATLEVVGNMKLTGIGHGLIFADGTEQTTASGGLSLPFSGSASSGGPVFSIANRGNPSGDGHGISGTTDGPNAAGVYGEAFNGSANFGVVGRAHGGSATGVFGDNPAGNAGDFNGDLHVSHTARIGADLYVSGCSYINVCGSPGKEEYSTSTSSGGAQLRGVQDGIATTDEQGLATISLPADFARKYDSFTYQLTTIAQFAQAIIAEEIHNGRFLIRTNVPKVKVSWQVTGGREDASANAAEAE
jgi:hypothetical protein